MRLLRTCGAALLAAATLMAMAVPVSAEPADSTHSLPRGQLQAELEKLVDSGEATAALLRISQGWRHWSTAAGVRDLESRRPARREGKFRIASTTKAFTATVVLQLVDEGRVGLDAPVERYLPGLVPNGENITVRQVLNHSSGLDDFASHPGYEAWNYAALQHSYTPEEVLEFAFSHPPLFPPGQDWDYSNTNYVLAGQLVEAVTGNSWAEEVRHRILWPLGLWSTTLPGTSERIPQPYAHGYMEVSPAEGQPPELIDVSHINPSMISSAGEIISTTADLDRFFGALLGGRLTSAESLAEMRTPAEHSPPQLRYGLGLHATTLSCGVTVWGHNGGALGYTTIAGRSDEGRQLTLSVNPYRDNLPGEPITRIGDLAFCDR
ncbi:serine hydrolase domain-containing protein [Amycolatopsis cihanbeyliensis]|uniref:D-alanyl-D-alanine carboxypeptidase n=1 Tax=Amycolatopsis cihanbeyliensis TaxID=1128664 RepID=A0A542DNC7_AMYCI|nr:serine hydrolase domain-containing protein [Amycolatopsis cihanbeyliensis]TQJ04609.1 D-alanyl-D-alanine carboxypeptidase [Amycolatopsis cihanbeyliensis]